MVILFDVEEEDEEIFPAIRTYTSLRKMTPGSRRLLVRKLLIDKSTEICMLEAQIYGISIAAS